MENAMSGSKRMVWVVGAVLVCSAAFAICYPVHSQDAAAKKKKADDFKKWLASTDQKTAEAEYIAKWKPIRDQLFPDTKGETNEENVKLILAGKDYSLFLDGGAREYQIEGPALAQMFERFYMGEPNKDPFRFPLRVKVGSAWVARDVPIRVGNLSVIDFEEVKATAAK
jgi:hypothetical protein